MGSVVDPNSPADGEHPELLVAYLRYALADARRYSGRSARLLEAAIEALTEDTKVRTPCRRTPAGHRMS